MAATTAATDHEPRVTLDALDDGVHFRLLCALPLQEVCTLAQTSKAWAELARAPRVWQALMERDHGADAAACRPGLGGDGSHLQAGGGGDSAVDWRLQYWRAHALRSLGEVSWQRVAQRGDKPAPREGHAACAWGDAGLLVFGGFGYGIRNDVWHWACGADGGEGAWRQPSVAGQPPSERYGHSLTRCGAAGELAVVFGGMRRGGYSGEVNDVAALRALPHPAPEGAAGGDGRGKRAAAAAELEWVHREVGGQLPTPRAYHSAAAAEDGRKVYFFGGIGGRQSLDDLVALDVDAWRWEHPATTGDSPAPRFGHSSAVYGGKLWVVGGGRGNDLLRSGSDFDDVYCLDLSCMRWARVQPTNPCPRRACMGRCHAAALVGSQLVLFGGSLAVSNALCVLDLATHTWGATRVLGSPPCGRISHSLARQGDRLLLFGGWSAGRAEVADMHALHLLPHSLLRVHGWVLDADDDARRGSAAASACHRWPAALLALVGGSMHLQGNSEDVFFYPYGSSDEEEGEEEDDEDDEDYYP